MAGYLLGVINEKRIKGEKRRAAGRKGKGKGIGMPVSELNSGTNYCVLSVMKKSQICSQQCLLLFALSIRRK